MPVTDQPQFIDVGDRRIATLNDPGGSPGLMWLPGFKSEMTSTKATALAAWAHERKLASTRFDYSGHGQSSGNFTEGRIGLWLEEAAAVFTSMTRGPQIVVGSSMGGYIALLLLRHFQRHDPGQAGRIRALVLIAPAWDMTEELMWSRFDERIKSSILATGVWERPSAYGDSYPITLGLIEEARNHLLARKPWDPGCPVRIIHGQLDPDVPWQHSQDLAAFLQGDRTEITTVEDGEHRLSRPQDIELMFAIIDRLMSSTVP